MKIAVVEDSREDADLLLSYFARYGSEHNLKIEAKVYANGMIFLDEKLYDFDAFFFDIDMPGVNGLSVSKEVRENNFSAPIVFVTNFQNYAIEGYNVSAIDFAVKPLMYSRFETVMLKIVRSLGSASKTIFLKTNVSTLKIAIDSIYYAESYGHLLYVHADNGTYECWMSLKQFEKLVDSPSFVRINKSIIINLRHISSIKNSTIFIGEATFELSKSKKDSFNNAFYSYINR